jgi:hypothetical protein
MTIWRIRIACRLSKVIHTYSQYVIHIAFPWQQWLYLRAAILRCTYSACLVFRCEYVCVCERERAYYNASLGYPCMLLDCPRRLCHSIIVPWNRYFRISVSHL